MRDGSAGAQRAAGSLRMLSSQWFRADPFFSASTVHEVYEILN